MREQPDGPRQEPHVGIEGFDVWWEPIKVSPDDVMAELPDGTRLKPVPLLGGRRLGFDRPLPTRTVIFHRGRQAWVLNPDVMS